MPIDVPDGVVVDIKPDEVTVTGPKGQLRRRFNADIDIAINNNSLIVSRPSDDRIHRSLHGLTRSLLANMVEGVSKPGLRVYTQRKEIPRVYGGLGIVIISTPNGVMTGQQAWRKGVGGELLCYVW